MDEIKEVEDVPVDHPSAKNICAIDKSSIHRICSGQVVLTLATAVKELLENSIDAGATIVDIKLKDYGSELVEVTDNGSGVEEKNFEGLTLKHYTSKLQEFTDLVNVETFGFRGEALSSLCALSHLSVTTRHLSAAVGTKLEFDHNGKITRQTAQARQVGTTVMLQNLFYTLPVRHKEFQRNLKREFVKMVAVLNSYCIISTGIRITCTNQTAKGSRSVVVASKGNVEMQDNISNIFGPKQMQSLLGFQQKEPGEDTCQEFGLKQNLLNTFRIAGFVSKCEHGQGRSSTDRQFFFINGRPFDSAKLSKVVNEVYHQYNRHQYPFVVFKITVQKDNVDVNVTPDKRQVFMEGEKQILATVKASLVALYEPTTSMLLLQQPFKPLNALRDTEASQRDLGLTRHSSLEKTPSSSLSSLLKLKRSFSSAFARDSGADQSTLGNDRTALKQRRLDGFISVNNGSQSTDDLDTGDHETVNLTFDQNHYGTVMDETNRTEIIDTSGLEDNIEDTCQTDMHTSIEENEGLTGSQNGSKIHVKDANKPKMLIDFHSCSTDNRTQTNFDHDSEVMNKSHLSQSFKISQHLSVNIQPESCVKIGPFGDGIFQDKRTEELTYFGCKESDVPLLSVECRREKSEEIYCGNDVSSTEKLGHFNSHSICTNKDQNGGNKPPIETSNASTRVHSVCDTNESLDETSLSQCSLEQDVHRQTSVVRTFRMSTSMDSNGVSTDDEDTNKDAVTLKHVIDTNDIDAQEEVNKKEKLISFSMEALRGRWKHRALSASSGTERFARAFRATISPTENQAAEQELQREIQKDMFSQMDILGQFNLGFIIARLDRDLFIVDQHATDEKYNFESLQRDYVIQCQKLICPMNLELTASNETILMDNLDIFRMNGFEFHIDQDSQPTQRVKLVSTPVSKNWMFGKGDIEEMIFMLTESPGVSCRPSRVRDMFASRACRKSVMIGTYLNKTEMKKLVSHMGDLDQPWNCPHGRPTMRHLMNLEMLPT
ncbi:mismatch repair endonuclease PMS2-like [Dreissena polymorpha]|uniref:mismatch repair endonuclease PMS2-like n=1 Tax=Dreissena polymorpha TaxID=45954 RepID=UPI0022642B84|nr:mismatch repair endonuclease PMS2-like [Dreissena polymorpha]